MGEDHDKNYVRVRDHALERLRPPPLFYARMDTWNPRDGAAGGVEDESKLQIHVKLESDCVAALVLVFIELKEKCYISCVFDYTSSYST